MNRRTFLGTLAGAGAAGLAGCAGIFEVRQAGAPPVLEDRPDAVYYPTHVEGMSMVGSDSAGDYGFALTYSYPHRFWTVTATVPEKTAIAAEDSVHLMALVWDRETGVVLPNTGLSVEITNDDGFYTEEVVYPMLSQPMGFHYGANFPLSGDGTYDVTVSVGGIGDRVARRGSLEGKFTDPANVTIPFEYSESAKSEIRYERTPDRAGERAAVAPMEMGMLPNTTAPEPDAMPGEAVGEATFADARFVVRALDDYLIVSPRTPYNRMILPMMACSATVERDGEAVSEGGLTPTLDPDLNFHYGASVEGLSPEDSVTLTVETPPQVARHEGYETAFLETGSITLG